MGRSPTPRAGWSRRLAGGETAPAPWPPFPSSRVCGPLCGARGAKGAATGPSRYSTQPPATTYCFSVRDREAADVQAGTPVVSSHLLIQPAPPEKG